jgi:hypothetical protein
LATTLALLPQSLGANVFLRRVRFNLIFLTLKPGHDSLSPRALRGSAPSLEHSYRWCDLSACDFVQLFLLEKLHQYSSPVGSNRRKALAEVAAAGISVRCGTDAQQVL